MAARPRQLKDLVPIGPAMLRDFEMLKIHSVADLAKVDPRRMYQKLCPLTGERQDPCVLNVFRSAVDKQKICGSACGKVPVVVLEPRSKGER